ncbi:hypothetical protein G1H11_04390 [Phytoactinopolyspora alkaliphila]|uniref:Uncharacterized protein n=1 Tax=Phytoactinopolyspora alkaliphila TaxID=1783498 RepID=A0A6N9YHX8_9ACTN|nr:hypothetical protein [Phytoactinopolyspora alkaliphila]NED94545.1 hypothetical protein [Phytoactinopolyspora alkaliphila]
MEKLVIHGDGAVRGVGELIADGYFFNTLIPTLGHAYLGSRSSLQPKVHADVGVYLLVKDVRAGIARGWRSIAVSAEARI